MWRAQSAMGITGADRRKLIGCLTVCRETETASLWLCRRRADKWKTSRKDELPSGSGLGLDRPSRRTSGGCSGQRRNS